MCCLMLHLWFLHQHHEDHVGELEAGTFTGELVNGTVRHSVALESLDYVTLETAYSPQYRKLHKPGT